MRRSTRLPTVGPDTPPVVAGTALASPVVTRRRSTTPSLRQVGRSALALAAAALAIVACDTGDGTRLQTPAVPTTLPPPDTTPLASVAIDDVAPSLGDLPVVAPQTIESALVPEAQSPGFAVFAPWAEAGPIDARYTCDGSNASPPLSWSEVPEGTSELAVSLVDESDLSSGRPFVHWVIGGLDPGLGRLDEATVPLGALQALNFFGDVAYTGPCPNPGETHTYRVTLYALGQQLEASDGTPAIELLDLIDVIAIGSTSTLGTATR